MKLATCQVDERATVCLVDAEAQSVRPLAGMPGMLALIGGLLPLRRLPALAGPPVPFSEVRFMAPLPRPPRNILCVGKNYYAHAREFSDSGFDTIKEAIPDAPIVFTKAPECVIATAEPIVLPVGLSDKIDYEAELAIVIGKPGRAIDRANAYDHVWGYTALNDVTARDLQSRHGQWFLGKSLDTFCPMGPWITTHDEIDAGNLRIRCRVNGELRQDASTRDLIFDIPTLIATISAGMTLLPGDIIATGTPAGVGIGFDPPKFLRSGDRITIEIEGIGMLENVTR